MGHGMAPAGKPHDLRRALGRLVGELRHERLLITISIALSVVAVALNIAGPKLLGNATNIIFEGVVGKMIPAGMTQAQAEAMLRATDQGQLADMLSGMTVTPGAGIDFAALAQTLVLVSAVYLLASVFTWAAAWIMAGVAQRTVYRLRREVDEKLARLPLSYFDRHARGDLLSRVTNDIDNIAQTLQQSLTQLITAVLTVIGVLIMMLTISPLLAIISILVVPTAIVVTFLIARRSQVQFTAQWERTGTLNGFVEEMHTGHGLVKVFGHQDEAIAAFDAENRALYDASYRAQFISGIIQPVMNFVSNLNYVAIAVIGGIRVANGTMTLGDVQAFIQYSRQFTMPITQTASIMNVMQSAAASAERVFELLDEEEEVPDPVDARYPTTVEGRIELTDVSFRYVPDKPLIEGLTELVHPGETLAIVGPTGAGKTTLVNLLMRFYDIDGGTITLDGIETRSMRRDELRRTFGMVLQDTWLFGGTIRENIAYGREDATEDEIVAAAIAAHVDHFVRTLPAGYDTVIDDEASNLSQGEKQLLTIARAFLADPEVLILDEATSSVDTRTEILVQRAMKALMHGRTSFVIAHRLSTIRDADTILVMDHGRIVEQGRHEELLARHGFYAELYQSQFAEPLAEAV
ncbi:MAG: ABC transporter ATP-binding protein/permease [Chloroflexi bacterium]|nr:ABC transporter ATP-binding protein/permease [Chloroflexota bacterium]